MYVEIDGRYCLFVLILACYDYGKKDALWFWTLVLWNGKLVGIMLHDFATIVTFYL